MSQASLLTAWNDDQIQGPLPLIVGGEWRESQSEYLAVINKWTEQEITEVSLATSRDLEDAILEGKKAESVMAALVSYERQSILEQITEGIQQHREVLVQCLMWEAGKTFKDAQGEVARLVDTFKYAAAESVRLQGEVLDLEVTPRAKGYQGFTRLQPKGLCSFITPFNFPLNLLAHKVAPAIAAGCPFIVKPASYTPISALLLGEIMMNAGLPPGAFSILPMDRQVADVMVTDDRFQFLSFTGSDQVGWNLKARAGMKPVTLELGGNAPCLVFGDSNLDQVVERLVFGAFYQAGQSCISVQRILVESKCYLELRQRLKAAVENLEYLAPHLENAFLSPLIDAREVLRLQSWIQEAVSMGAQCITGGTTVPENARVLSPCLMEGVPTTHSLWTEEAFGPVALLTPFETDDEAFALANTSRFGLQAGVFTQNQAIIQKAWRQLKTGAVIINEVPSWRVDHMPYGGVGASGLGREGVRYAIEEMSDIKLLVEKY